MSKPLVAVVGRPNVGKSTFFNYVAGRRVSIVDDKPGVTRDRVYSEAEWCGHEFDMVDTGGIEPSTSDELLRQMRRQAQIAIETADVILLLVDSRSGIQAADSEIAGMLRKAGKPVLLVVNKCDTPGPFPPEAYEFYNLGLGEVYPISSIHGLGMGDLLDAIVERFPTAAAAQDMVEPIKVAIVGKPNVGKSSLVNRLTGEDRAIVSDTAGTTRDAIDSALSTDEGDFLLIDTAGMRKKSRISDDVEHYSILRAVGAIERSDVCVIMLSAEHGITEQDTKIAGLAHNAGKASIVVVNKWDLIEKDHKTADIYKAQIKERLSFMDYAPILFVSAKTGQRIERILPAVREAYEMSIYRVPTGVLNDVIGEAQAITPAPTYKGRRLKIKYVTQPSIQPPTFVLFVNSVELMHFSYERYLENQLRRQFGFVGTPLVIQMKGPRKETD
ncbi:MAG: ribosome biogenesis GTPase Der [Fastidiosipilaceae bacterium]|jgi:GTP-binding protein